MNSALLFGQCGPNNKEVETYRTRTKDDEWTDKGVSDYDT